jgi:hypothetical protein
MENARYSLLREVWSEERQWFGQPVKSAISSIAISCIKRLANQWGENPETSCFAAKLGPLCMISCTILYMLFFFFFGSIGHKWNWLYGPLRLKDSVYGVWLMRDFFSSCIVFLPTDESDDPLMGNFRVSCFH